MNQIVIPPAPTEADLPEDAGGAAFEQARAEWHERNAEQQRRNAERADDGGGGLEPPPTPDDIDRERAAKERVDYLAPRLNLDAAGLESHLAERMTKADAAVRAYQQVATMYNSLCDADDAEARTKHEAEYEPQMIGAEIPLHRAAQQLRMAAAGVQKATATAPLNLEPSEMAVAANLRPFVKDQAESADLSDVRDGLAHALATADRPRLYCYATYLPQRIKSLRFDENGIARPMRGVDSKIASEMAGMLAEARTRLTDRSLAALNEKASAQIQRATKLETLANQRRRKQEMQRQREKSGAVLWNDSRGDRLR